MTTQTEDTQTIAETIEQFEDDPTMVVFYSRVARLRLIRQNRTEVPIPTGGWVQGLPSVKYEFMAGSLAVKQGQDVLPDGPGGAEQDAVAWLMAHPALNVEFWRDGEEPGRLQPTDREVHAEITDALIERDEVKLIAIIERERETHKRKALIDAAKDAIERLRALQGAQQEDAETPTAAVEPAEAPFDRDDAIRRLQGIGIEVKPEVTDEQLQSALLVAGLAEG